MNTEIEIIATDKVSNQAAMRSVLVMEQWGNGETYSEERWVERGRQAVRQTMEGMFELGRALIILKEHTEHGRFMEIVKSQFGLGIAETSRLMSATRRFATPQMQKAAPKLMDLGKSKLLELLVEEDVTLVGLAEGEEVNGMTFDDVDRMTVRELRVALRESRENLAAKDEVMKTKTAKIDELTEKLAKKQTVVREPKAEDVGSELAMQLTSLEVGIRSQVSRLKDLFDQLNAHSEAHEISHQAKMVGTLNQIILDCEQLRESYALPTEAPTDNVPEWLGGETGEGDESGND
ncbi:TPA: DUF3102 domain-containing protein [Neisseria meningitidis]|uniref:DUF3102 domain-containing protein n=3 Tax=Neisseria meningitidis TaxID=487 RepID=A0A112R3Z2_NEIME|nr:DUF3102 domain-containing protein [Neisseria meningitidis]EOC23808.1 hypothetical protein NM3147_1049 [Neisseria meningitidis NM3147]EOC41555.1 hypothetical protein NM2005079_0951 [Neisseria meningitidis 2005079]CCI72647.1 hypothetical protein BN21_0612 [Neisseria meningitidis alpha704]ABX73130.1 conserved hypothetical protein [Neisseria meningitidis 053442]AIZ17249.1 hypothetical protein LA50_00785 [Neisseria meningitidis]